MKKVSSAKAPTVAILALMILTPVLAKAWPTRESSPGRSVAVTWKHGAVVGRVLAELGPRGISKCRICRGSRRGAPTSTG